MTSNDRFTAILQRIQETHDKKQADYGTDEDPFANITAAKELDIEPWVACVLRMNDKMMRLKAFIKKGELVNESVEDSLLDMAVYAIIALTVYPQDKPRSGSSLKEGDLVYCDSQKSIHAFSSNWCTNPRRIP